MTSLETTEDRMGKTKVTATFFKKLGEKLRNQQRYQNLEQLSDLSNTRSDPLDSMKNHNKLESKELAEKSSNAVSFRRFSRENENIPEFLTKDYQPARSATSISKQSQNNITSNEGSSFTATTSSSISMATNVKSVDKFHDGIKTHFNLGNNNVLSILKSKNDPKMIIYDLQNPNGCKIHLEKMGDRAMLLSVDNTGKRFHISCNF